MTKGSKSSTRSKTGTRKATSSKPAKRGSTNRSSSAKSSTKSIKNNSKRREADSFRDNYDPSLIWFLSIVIISVIYYFLVANAGDGIGVIGSFFFGLFGYMAYVFPVALLAGYLLNINNRSALIGGIKSVCVGVIFVILCTYSQLFTGLNQEIEVLGDYYEYSAEYGNGGGITGGLIHNIFRDAPGGDVWCFLLLLIFLILCFVGITGKKFIGDTREFITEFIENMKDGYYEDQIRREERFERGLAKRENRQRRAEEKKELRQERRRKREEIQEKLRREKVVSGVSMDTQLVAEQTEVTKLKSSMPTPDEYGLNKTVEEITAKINRPVSMEEIKASAPYMSPQVENHDWSFENANAYSEMINSEMTNSKPQSEYEEVVPNDSYYSEVADNNYDYNNDYNNVYGDNFINSSFVDNSYTDADYEDRNVPGDSFVTGNGLKITTMSSGKNTEVRSVGGTRTYEERVFTGPNVDRVTTDGESLNPWTSKLADDTEKVETTRTPVSNSNDSGNDNKADTDDLRELISIPLEEKGLHNSNVPGAVSMTGFSRKYDGLENLEIKRNAHEGLFKSSPDVMQEISLSFDEENIADTIEKNIENILKDEDTSSITAENEDNLISKISIRRDPHINAEVPESLRREHRIHILDNFAEDTGNTYDDAKEPEDSIFSKEHSSSIFDDIKEDNFDKIESDDDTENEEDILKTFDRSEKSDIFEDLKRYDSDRNEPVNNRTESPKLYNELKYSVEKPASEIVKSNSEEKRFGDEDTDKEEIVSDISFSGINKPGNSFNIEEEKEEKPEIISTSQIRVTPSKEYTFPPLELLREGKVNENMETEEELHQTAADLQRTLKTFGVNVEMKEINQGPSITRFEMIPEEGTKVSKITKLTDDIKLNMAAKDVRIEAPIPGKKAVGIELPNKEVTPVVFRELIDTDIFREASSKVSFAVGKSLTGETVVTDIAKMPHVLIAGTTGSGKSVCINTLIMSILYKARPDEVKLILVDPKVVELSIYNGIPHLLIPVVTDAKKASAALNWACVEMDDRYQKFADYGVRNLKGYNEKIAKMTDVPKEDRPEKMYQMVVVVDELADLMMVASKEVEDSICRLAQKARACGIHLVIATQRPSVDVITGLIKANFPSRIAFAVNSQIDSRTILDSTGAERLLGKGDMLFAPQGQKPERLQGAFIDDDEVTAVVDFLKENAGGEQYNDDVIAKVEAQSNASNASTDAGKPGMATDDSSMDELFVDVAKFCIERDKASASVIQRKFRLGWNRAARIMDQLYEAGIISGEEGTKPRRVLISMEEFENGLEQGDY